MDGELPSGTLTFLFTDLVGSTRLWERHPEAMRDALARHDTLLSEAVSVAGGRIVKHTGDGLHAVFGTAVRAVEAALAAQLALRREVWGATGPLEVRMALHTGESQERARDYFGPVLNRAARLMSTAHGGQVVLSEATASIVRDALPDGIGLLDLGEHRLSDLSRPEHAYQLTHPDLERDFPPLRSLGSFPGNLPEQVTSFVGRAEEMAAVADVLREHRLVTLSGAGGVGKTRLAVQTAAVALPAHADGAWLCELAVAADREAMNQVVAGALGLRPDAVSSLEPIVLDWLCNRRLLLVLDNCEHLLDHVSRLAEQILGTCPYVHVLATSREPLDIAGERVMRVRSLAVPEEGADVERYDQTDAMKLFVDRATSAEPDLRLHPSDARVIAEICRRLDGIPLAIELAAVRVASMTPAEILARLDERFRLLTGGRRTALERHQTLRATVDWSYSLLEPSEQGVFDRLGVFPGSFDAAAGCAVASGDDVESWDVLDALSGLVHKSMVTIVGTSGTSTRYQLLETMRQYARERLDQTGDADTRRRVHARHFAARADETSRAFATGQNVGAAHLTGVLDVDNYRAALTWALDSDAPGDVDLAFRIAARHAGADPATRTAAGLVGQTDRLLQRAPETSRDLGAAVLAGQASDELYLRGDVVAAEALAQRALEEGPRHGGALTAAYMVLIMSALGQHDVTRALGLIDEAEDRMSELGFGTLHGRAFFDNLRVLAEDTRGNRTVAREHAVSAVELARQADLPFRLVQALSMFARVVFSDDPAAAERALDEADQLGPTASYGSGTGTRFLARARIHMVAGRGDEALGFAHAAALALDSFTALQTIVAAAAVVAVLVEESDPRAAAVLVGAARHGPYAPLLFEPQLSAELQAMATRLSAVLGSEVYDADLRRGAELSKRALIDFVVRATDAPGSSAGGA